MRGVFITIEGGEGVGKSTQSAMLARRVRAAGHAVLETREPGGTPAGDRIRELLLDPSAEIDPIAEVLLYEASRAEIVARVIEPALAAGTHVVCDRFIDSTLAYQSYGRGLDADVVRTLDRIATRGLMPDVTVLLVLDPAEAMRRATAGGADRIELESSGFHDRVNEGFLRIARDQPRRVVVVDAAGAPDAVADRVWEALAAHPAMGRLTAEGERP